MNHSWDEITKNDIINAINKFDKEHINPSAAKSTFLIYNIRKYPAKHIRAMAYEITFNEEISKSEFSGGKETARETL